jgi:hypothetical protein
MVMAAVAVVMLMTALITKKSLSRLTLPAEICQNLPFEAICAELVNSWVSDPSLNYLSCKF